MIIGFSVSESGRISANALTNEETATDFAKGVEEDGELFAGYVNLDGVQTDDRGDLGPAFEALRSLIGVNHFHNDSLCYAVEEMLERVFEAGREFERNQAAKLIAPNPTEELGGNLS